ncbi:MAG: hypothetical protein PVG12_01690 [Gammaproteobacteria bacterium]
MVIHKACSRMFFRLFACLLVVMIAGCGGSSGGGGTGSDTPSGAGFTELTAVPGPMVAVRVGETAALDGSGSAASSTEVLNYSWSFSSKPHGSVAQLQGATTPTPSFVADVRGVYRLQLQVSTPSVTSPRTVAIVVATNNNESLIGPFRGHQGMSSNCVDCHDGVNKVGNGNFIDPKYPDHLATSNMCQACHTPQGFAITPFVDHAEIFGNCSDCHNNVRAIGKSEFHQPTQAECNECHNTSHFLELLPDGSFDHSTITRACSGCHNGTVAIGKTPSPPAGTHPDTTSECGYCHTTASFLNAYPDHTGPAVVGNRCDSCHVADGSGPATGQIVGHPDTTSTNVDCGTCHSITTFSLGGIFNHGLLDSTVQSCESCHNDTNSINAPGKGSAHPPTSSDCSFCHNTLSFSPAFSVDHTGIVDNCGVSCHVADGSGTASGMPPSTPFYAHMPTSEDCSVCHTPGTFSTGTYDHAGVVNGCTACHDNRVSVGKLPNHIPTTPDDQDCAACHTTASFIGALFDHTSTDTSNCLACHDGNISTGKPVGHVTTSENCSSCHIINNGFSTFAGTFMHDLNIVGGDCASCHNTGIATPKKVNHIPAQDECSTCHIDTSAGGFVSSTFLSSVHPGITSGCEGCHTSQFIPDNPALIKTASHLPVTQDCNVCHTNTNTAFTPSIFSHAGITGNCASCHDGSADNVLAGATGMTPNHPPTNGQDCGVCHGIGANFTDGIFDHTGIVNNCTQCHGDNATGSAVKKHAGHVPTTQDCSVCHVPGTFTDAVFDHTGIVDNCSSCHDGAGAIATVKPLDHLSTTQDCVLCHNTTAFAGAKFDHTGITGNCASCHDGVTAPGKMPPPDHVPTTGDCSECHVTTGFIPATFSHVGIVDNCRSCHNNTFAIGKPINHIPTSQDCGICHNTSGFFPATFDHTGIVDNCASCHNGVNAIGMDAKTNPPHLSTNLDCSACHTTATFVGGAWIHDASSAGNCDQCHVNGGDATPKPMDHINTTFQCDACHVTTGWAPTSFSHDPQGNYPGDHRRNLSCSSCHGNSIDPVFDWPYPQYAPFCAACHANDFEPKDKHIGGESGTVEQNKNCAGSGCHSVNSSEF